MRFIYTVCLHTITWEDLLDGWNIKGRMLEREGHIQRSMRRPGVVTVHCLEEWAWKILLFFESSRKRFHICLVKFLIFEARYNISILVVRSVTRVLKLACLFIKNFFGFLNHFLNQPSNTNLPYYLCQKKIMQKVK